MTTQTELPASWQQPQPEPVPSVKIPDPPSGDDYAELAAWYSGFSYAEHYRKVVQSLCQEVVRAEYAARGEKITEARIETLARLHSAYLAYLEKHLHGRARWEAAFLAQGGMR